MGNDNNNSGSGIFKLLFVLACLFILYTVWQNHGGGVGSGSVTITYGDGGAQTVIPATMEPRLESLLPTLQPTTTNAPATIVQPVQVNPQTDPAAINRQLELLKDALQKCTRLQMDDPLTNHHCEVPKEALERFIDNVVGGN